MLGVLGFIVAWAPTGAGPDLSPVQAPPGTMGAALRDYETLHAPTDPQAAVTCAQGTTLPGIDVSKWQGGIDWSAVAGAGMQYAFVRCSHGLNTIDEYFDANWEQSRAAGIATGVYQYFEPGQDPIAQADLLLDMMGPLQPGDLPPVIDVESHGNLPAAEVAAAVVAWVNHVEAQLGVKPIVYTGRYFWQDYVQSNALVDYPLWIAHYTTDCPNIPAPWTTWAFHQYTSSGSVSGVAGNVDRNDFNGEKSKLLELGLQNEPPEGWIDEAGCEGVAGWAADPVDLGVSLQVDVAFDGTTGEPDRVLQTWADLHRQDLCDLLGSCEHGFELQLPARYHDGLSHMVQATIYDGAGQAIALQGGPTDFTCPPPTFSDGAMRPLPAGASQRWGFDPSLDVLSSDPTGGALEQGLDWPEQPLLVHVEGLAEVWLVDRGTKRSLDEQTAAGWGLDLSSAMPWPADSVQELPEGPALSSRPWLVQDQSGALFVLDAAAAPPEGEGDSGDGSDGGNTGGGDEDPDDGGTGGTDTGDPGASSERGGDDDRGCRVAQPQPTPAVLLLGLLGFAARRRR